MSESTRTIARFQYFQDKVCERKLYWHGNGFVLLETHFRKRANSLSHKDSSSLLHRYLTVCGDFFFELFTKTSGLGRKNNHFLGWNFAEIKSTNFFCTCKWHTPSFQNELVNKHAIMCQKQT